MPDVTAFVLFGSLELVFEAEENYAAFILN